MGSPLARRSMLEAGLDVCILEKPVGFCLCQFDRAVPALIGESGVHDLKVDGGLFFVMGLLLLKSSHGGLGMGDTCLLFAIPHLE